MVTLMLTAARASACVQQHPTRLKSHEGATMITRIAIRLLLLPLLVLALPLMFAWAWIKEATVERAPRSQASLTDW
jgi:hypothetical protein